MILPLRHEAGFDLYSKSFFQALEFSCCLSQDVLSWALPVFQFPTPTGPYQVGTSQWHLMDKSREETHTDQPDDYREISVYGWYPAECFKGINKTAEIYEQSKTLCKECDSCNGNNIGPKWLR